MPPAQTKEVIERELNAPLEDVFEWIDLEKPLGSASISQVTFLLLRSRHTYASAVTLAETLCKATLHIRPQQIWIWPHHAKCTPLPGYTHQATTVCGTNQEIASWHVCNKQTLPANTMFACNIRPLIDFRPAIAGPQG